MDLALTHQAVAIVVLTLAVLQAERLMRIRRDPFVQGIGQPVTLARLAVAGHAAGIGQLESDN